MYLKLNLLLLFTFTALACFSQQTIEQKDSTAKSLTPVADKAIVYIIRPSGYGALVRMSIELDDTHIGATGAGRYVYTIAEPGQHTLVSKAESNASLSITLEAGKVYYIKQQVKMGLLYAETGLKILDEKDGLKFLKKCKLAKDNVYSN